MADSSYIYVNGHPVELQVPDVVQTCLPIGTAALCVIAVFTAVRSFR